LIVKFLFPFFFHHEWFIRFFCRPNPNIKEIESAVHDFCSSEWSFVKENMLNIEKHAYTKNSQLPYRCVEALYMATLLEYGFGFDVIERNITLALEVLGHEVEWTLGFALAEVNIDIKSSDILSTSCKKYTRLGFLSTRVASIRHVISGAIRYSMEVVNDMTISVLNPIKILMHFLLAIIKDLI
jgi:hypothetical protein